MTDKVRIGLLIDSFVLPAWVVGMIKKIIAINNVEIVVVILNSVALKNTHSKHSLDNTPSRIYKLYAKLDRLAYKSFPDASEPTDLSPLIKNIQQLPVTTDISGNKKELSETDINAIRAYSTDVLIKLGFENLSGTILDVPKLGTWSLDCYQGNMAAGIPAASCFFNNEDITPSAVHILHNDPAKQKTIYRSFSMTDKKSLNRNLNQVCWKSLSFIPRLLSLLIQNGENWFWDYVEKNNNNPENKAGPAKDFISNKKIVATLINKSCLEIGNRLKGIAYPDNWNLFYHTGKSDHIETALPAFRKLACPKGAFWADPHVVNLNNRTFIFFEEWDFKKSKGHISTFEFTNENMVPEVRKVLEKPYHLSYPFTFECNGVYYMIPETAANKTIELYRCTKFPEEWVFVMNLMEHVHAVDTTLHFYNNTWWLFANMVENAGGSSLDELFIFYAADFLTTNWVPHKLNPVVSDARRARPAGAFFELDGKLYRPSQSSTKIYGTSVNINEVEQLNAGDYKEIVVETIEPGESKNIRGIHSFSKKGGLTVIDAFLKR